MSFTRRDVGARSLSARPLLNGRARSLGERTVCDMRLSRGRVHLAAAARYLAHTCIPACLPVPWACILPARTPAEIPASVEIYTAVPRNDMHPHREERDKKERTRERKTALSRTSPFPSPCVHTLRVHVCTHVRVYTRRIQRWLRQREKLNVERKSRNAKVTLGVFARARANENYAAIPVADR